MELSTITSVIGATEEIVRQACNYRALRNVSNYSFVLKTKSFWSSGYWIVTG
jgi:hypothetical protein